MWDRTYGPLAAAFADLIAHMGRYSIPTANATVTAARQSSRCEASWKRFRRSSYPKSVVGSYMVLGACTWPQACLRPGPVQMPAFRSWRESDGTGRPKPDAGLPGLMRESGVRAENGVSASNLHRCRTADAPRPETWGERGGDRRDAPCLGPVRSDRRDVRPLAHHCMDVAAAFAETMRLPVVRDRLDEASVFHSPDVQRGRLSVLALLHDIGELHPGFQAKGWPPGAWRGPLLGRLREGRAFPLLANRWSGRPFFGVMQGIMQRGGAVFPLRSSAVSGGARPAAPVSSPFADGGNSTAGPFPISAPPPVGVCSPIGPAFGRPDRGRKLPGKLRNALDSASCGHASHGAAASSPSRAAAWSRRFPGMKR